MKFHLSYAHNELKAKHEAELKAKEEMLKKAEEEEKAKKQEEQRLKQEEEEKNAKELLATKAVDKTIKEEAVRHECGLVKTEPVKLEVKKETAVVGCGLKGPLSAVKASEVKTELPNNTKDPIVPTANGLVVPRQQITLPPQNTEGALNLSRNAHPSAQQQISPSGRATAVVKPILSHQPLMHATPPNSPLYKPASQQQSASVNGSYKRAPSPAYSDISDEENEVIPLPNPKSHQSNKPMASAGLNLTAGAAAVHRNLPNNANRELVSGSLLPRQQQGPPGFFNPTSLQSSLALKASLTQSLMPPHFPLSAAGPTNVAANPPPPAHQAMAAMAAAFSSGQAHALDLFGPRATLPRASNGESQQALELLQQQAAATQAARQYLASSKLQELQEKAVIQHLTLSSSMPQKLPQHQPTSSGIYTNSNFSGPSSSSAVSLKIPTHVPNSSKLTAPTSLGNKQQSHPALVNSLASSTSAVSAAARQPTPAHMQQSLRYPAGSHLGAPPPPAMLNSLSSVPNQLSFHGKFS